MSPRDLSYLDDLLGPIKDLWRCRSCDRKQPVPSMARDCEEADLQAATRHHQPPLKENP